MSDVRPRPKTSLRVCAVCGQGFTAKQSKPQRCCSRACGYQSRKKAREGARPHATIASAVCEGCGVTFAPKHGTRGRYCSLSCRKNRVEHNCVTCGKSFLVQASRQDSSLHCSRACRYVGVKKVCEGCGQTFEALPASAWRRRFCNNACRRRKVEKQCETCGSAFWVMPCHASQRFCSRPCMLAAPRPDTKVCTNCGERKPVALFNWLKHGPASYCRPCLKLRRHTEAARWAQAIKKRDDYTCQFCQKRGGRVHADHILRVKDCPQYSLALWNGRTLCAECHRWRHNFNRRIARKQQQKK